jgi:hypothetical protein
VNDSIKDELRKAVARLLVENSRLRKDRALLVAIVRGYWSTESSKWDGVDQLVDALPEALKLEVKP